jgi:hypothetical protein
MAKIEIPARIEITDDLTGKPATDAKTVKVTVDGKTATLDLAAETLAALTAFLAEPSDENRREFGRHIPKPRVGQSGGAASGNGADKRAWLRANGYPNLAERGKFTDAMNAAWEKFNAEPASA